jgi:hypothetical protein
MRMRAYFPLLWVALFAFSLPALAWFGAKAQAEHTGLTRELAVLKRHYAAQEKELEQMDKDNEFAQLAVRFVDAAQAAGLTDKGLSAYPLIVRKNLEPAAAAAEVSRLRGQAGHYFRPHSLFYGRAASSIATGAKPNRPIGGVTAEGVTYLLVYEGQNLVINHD